MFELEDFKFLSLLPAAEIGRLRQVASQVSVPAGSEVFREGDSGDGLYLVKSGQVKIIAVVGQSDRQPITSLGPGEMFGEMAVLDSQPRSASVVAGEDSVLYFIPREPMLALLKRSPDLGLAMMQEITRRLREFNHVYVRKVIQAERMALVGRFASAMMHDLKNPLTVISIAADMVCQDFTEPEDRALCQRRIRKQIERISGMVSEVMEFTRGATTRLVLAPVEYPIYARTVVEEIQHEIAIKGVTVSFENPVPEVRVNINPERLSRVFWNLLFNAVDAMPDGGRILLRFAVRDGSVITEVEDTGTGIAPEIAGRLFEAFATHGKPCGTGLGLSIVRRIVEEHGGRIQARNGEGGGALFSFSLPLFDAPAAAPGVAGA